DQVPLAQPDRILHEGRVYLPLEVEARALRERALRPVAVLLPDVIEAVLGEGDPAELSLDRDDLQVGGARPQPGEDESRGGLGHGELAHQDVAHEAGRVETRHLRLATPAT